jgi:hypothetical protein
MGRSRSTGSQSHCVTVTMWYEARCRSCVRWAWHGTKRPTIEVCVLGNPQRAIIDVWMRAPFPRGRGAAQARALPAARTSGVRARSRSPGSLPNSPGAPPRAHGDGPQRRDRSETETKLKRNMFGTWPVVRRYGLRRDHTRVRLRTIRLPRTRRTTRPTPTTPLRIRRSRRAVRTHYNARHSAPKVYQTVQEARSAKALAYEDHATTAIRLASRNTRNTWTS